MAKRGKGKGRAAKMEPIGQASLFAAMAGKVAPGPIGSLWAGKESTMAGRQHGKLTVINGEEGPRLAKLTAKMGLSNRRMSLSGSLYQAAPQPGDVHPKHVRCWTCSHFQRNGVKRSGKCDATHPDGKPHRLAVVKASGYCTLWSAAAAQKSEATPRAIVPVDRLRHRSRLELDDRSITTLGELAKARRGQALGGAYVRRTWDPKKNKGRGGWRHHYKHEGEHNKKKHEASKQLGLFDAPAPEPEEKPAARPAYDAVAMALFYFEQGMTPVQVRQRIQSGGKLTATEVDAAMTAAEPQRAPETKTHGERAKEAEAAAEAARMAAVEAKLAAGKAAREARAAEEAQRKAALEAPSFTLEEKRAAAEERAKERGEFTPSQKLAATRQAAASKPTEAQLTAAGGKLWEKRGHRRVYFAARKLIGSHPGARFIKVWYDLNAGKWDTKGAVKQGLSNEEMIAAAITMVERQGTAKPEAGIPSTRWSPAQLRAGRTISGTYSVGPESAPFAGKIDSFEEVYSRGRGPKMYRVTVHLDEPFTMSGVKREMIELHAEKDPKTGEFLIQGHPDLKTGAPKEETKPAISHEALLARAAELGTRAFLEGKTAAIPMALAEEINEHTGGVMGGGIPYMEAFQRAWTKANLAAPLEGDLGAEIEAELQHTRDTEPGFERMPEDEPKPKRRAATSVEDDVRAAVMKRLEAKWAEQDAKRSEREEPSTWIDSRGNPLPQEEQDRMNAERAAREAAKTPEQRAKDEARQRERIASMRKDTVERLVRNEMGKRIVFPAKGKPITVDGKKYTVVSVDDSGDRQRRVTIKPTSKRAHYDKELLVWPSGQIDMWTPGKSGRNRPESIGKIEGVHYTNDEHPFHARAEVAREKRTADRAKREEEAKQRKYEEAQEKKRKKAEEKHRKAKERAERRAAHAAEARAKAAEARAGAEVPPDGTPRAKAIAETAELQSVEDDVTRASKFMPFGKKQYGSAKDLFEWKSIDDAVKSPDADEMFTRKFLSKEKPGRTLERVQFDVVDPFVGLLLHWSSNLFPAKTIASSGRALRSNQEGVKHVSEEDDRRGYAAAWEALRDVLDYRATHNYGERIRGNNFGESANKLAELVRAATPGTTRERGYMAGMKAEAALSDVDLAKRYYLQKVHTALSVSGWKRSNKNHPASKLAEFHKKLKEADAEGETIDDKAKPYALAVIEGKSLNKAFGQVQKREGQGPSEREMYDTSVMRRKGPPSRVQGDTVEERGLHAEKLIKGETFAMAGIDYGQWVPDEERAHHLKSFADSMEDMMGILGLPTQMAGYNGKLGLAFGARGKAGALAHYEPGANIINLTRMNGAGTIAHEWGHFFDFAVGKLDGDRTGRALSASGTGPAGEVREQMRALMNSPAMEKFRERLKGAVKEHGITGDKTSYWQSSCEVFARCFERHVQRKLNKAGRENTYLVGLMTRMASKGEDALWPVDEEVDALEPHFDRLFRTFAGSELLQKMITPEGEPLQKKLPYSALPITAPTHGAAPVWESQDVPDYADIYFQPESDKRNRIEREHQNVRRRANAKRNAGIYSFHGEPNRMEPALRYDPDKTLSQPMDTVAPNRVGSERRGKAKLVVSAKLDRLRAGATEQGSMYGGEDEEERKKKKKRRKRVRLVARRRRES
jgi:hypothetical protein